MQAHLDRSRRRPGPGSVSGATIDDDWPDEEPDRYDDLELDSDLESALDDPWPGEDAAEEAFPEPGDFWAGDWDEDE